MKPTLFPDTSVDTLIADRLPDWLTAATADQRSVLHQALIAQQRAREQLTRLFAQIEPLDSFASTSLDAALQRLVQRPVDVHTAKLRRVVHVRYPSGVSTVPDRVVATTSEQSLLACALHNFERRETSESAWLPESRLQDADGTLIALRPRAFAGLCRSLDVGALYQQHLKQVLFADDSRRRSVNAILEEAWRTNLLSALSRLRVLDLSHNPIGQLPPLGSLLNLQRLHLRHCGLSELPVEVYMHPALEDIDLRDNHIQDMSPTLARSHRRLAGLSLHDNPLPEPTQTALRSTLGEAGAGALPTRRHGPGGQESLERWLADFSVEERAIRSEQWLALTQRPGCDDLMRFLNDLGRSSDYDLQGIDLRRRIWALVEVCVENTQVREAIFQQAAGPRPAQTRCC
ncbi:hypothetical protein CXQ80_08630 [Pseudomonas sp. 02C 26]|nr:DUF6543 domain-containing protein [Pseudomonas sp. 02C 26]AUF95894.1 hypothetical protein CXQ80_08630 [Pseudomonas sp. 02C 26]